MIRVNSNIGLAVMIAMSAPLLFRSAAAQTGTGAVSGKLVTESGQPLVGASATYRRAQELVADSHFHVSPAPGANALHGSLTTHADGTFGTSGLPAGNYSLCLDNPPDLYVDPCFWNLGGTAFTVIAGSTTLMKPITIIAGVRVHFLISDPQGLLPAGSRLDPVAHIGVVMPGHIYRPVTVISHSGGVIDAVIIVPHNQPVNSWFSSNKLIVKDQTGVLAQGAAVSLTAGESDHNIILSVSR